MKSYNVDEVSARPPPARTLCYLCLLSTLAALKISICKMSWRLTGCLRPPCAGAPRSARDNDGHCQRMLRDLRDDEEGCVSFVLWLKRYRTEMMKFVLGEDMPI
ncbi:hypothetical protein EVAR_65603_1 [Eumeta japonica]|uniref:Uncharacterized protein n=1 Tax=Eumeta variegata TaxID=151549 RepID=A0A4C1ZX16_EUMVA|nr:hypothetical protein EVAR_65603_1 [Eumeta japonica]